MQPADGALRKQWMDAYLEALRHTRGESEDVAVIDDDAGANYCPDELVQQCQDGDTVTTLAVRVFYTPIPAPIAGAEVTIVGPRTFSQTTDDSGVALFENIEPGIYSVSATYRTGNPLVENAAAWIGSRLWGYRANRSPYGPDTNKCNLIHI